MPAMKERVRDCVLKALKSMLENAGADTELLPPIKVEVPADEKFGDFSTNAAMTCAKPLKSAPRKIAQSLLEELKKDDLFSSISLAGPGFINFNIKPQKWAEDFSAIPDDSSGYGNHPKREGEKILIEFVSANPTGPLHIGHGRGAAVGDVLCRLLSKAGYDVTSEYYINDAGLQMENLGRSTLARYRKLLGKGGEFPESGYKGDYIKDIAQEVVDKDGDKYLDMPEEESLPFFVKYSADTILNGIKDNLKRFRVHFDIWTSEKSFHQSGKVQKGIDDLKKSGAIFEKDGALWLNSSADGDTKDRVVKRANGVVTYLAADIAYHKDKYERGFTKLIDIWGADHHGYVARMKSAVKALGQEPDSLETLLIQLVALKRGGKTVSMSTRGATFVTLEEVLDEVGEDAARFFFMTRSYESHFDFDLDLAKEQSSENPVYYVQYAHARISNIFRTAVEKEAMSGIGNIPTDVDWSVLIEEAELRIMKKSLQFPEMVSNWAEALAPHHITHYLTDLASMFHKYYNMHRVVTDDKKVTDARLALIARLQTVISNGLDLLGVSAPDRM